MMELLSNLPAVSMEEVLGFSYRDFHCKGFDYICLRRSPIETIKVYFFDGDASKLPEIVNPHDHRYNFDTLCIAGAVENITFTRYQGDSAPDYVFHRFNYRTPLNGGNGFTYAETERLNIRDRWTYWPGEVYEQGYKAIHTIRMVENQTVIALRQFEDRVSLSASTNTWTRDREPPSLDGLYGKFTADEVRKRLAALQERVPGLRLPVIT